MRSDATHTEELAAARLLRELYTMHFLFTKKNVGKSDALKGDIFLFKTTKFKCVKPPCVHTAFKVKGRFYRDGKIGGRSARSFQHRGDVCD